MTLRYKKLDNKRICGI